VNTAPLNVRLWFALTDFVLVSDPPALRSHHGDHIIVTEQTLLPLLCSKIAEAEAAVSVNEKKWLVMHMLPLLVPRSPSISVVLLSDCLTR
jgi:hypothetical protein